MVSIKDTYGFSTTGLAKLYWLYKLECKASGKTFLGYKEWSNEKELQTADNWHYAFTHDIYKRKKKDNKFYNKEFYCGKISLSRGDIECSPCPMDTYYLSDEDMQSIVNDTNKEIVRLYGEDYDEYSEDVDHLFWSEVEGLALNKYVDYYEDYPFDIEEE